jgi:quercetin dioxygenase-like cupin family protein
MPLTRYDWSSLSEQTPFPGFHGKAVHSGAMSFVLWSIEAGARLPEHNHVHEQVLNVLDGEFELTVAGETARLGPGTLAVVPPDARHSGVALTSCRILDVFQPVREDYRHGLTSAMVMGKAET